MALSLTSWSISAAFSLFSVQLYRSLTYGEKSKATGVSEIRGSTGKTGSIAPSCRARNQRLQVYLKSGETQLKQYQGSFTYGEKSKATGVSEIRGSTGNTGSIAPSCMARNQGYRCIWNQERHSWNSIKAPSRTVRNQRLHVYLKSGEAGKTTSTAPSHMARNLRLQAYLK